MKNKRLRLLALALTATMALGACGSGESDQATDLPTLSSQSDDASGSDNADDEASEGDGEVSEEDQEKAFAEYESCMADAGVDVSSALGGGEGGAAIETFESSEGDGGQDFDPEAFEAATEACNEILESTFGSFEMSPEEEAEAADQMLEMQRCLSEEGFEIDLSGNSFELDENIDFEAFEDAMSTCGTDIGIESDQ